MTAVMAVTGDTAITNQEVKVKKGKGQYSSSWEPCLRATGRHLPHGSHSVTCHPTQVNAPRLTPAMQAGTRFTCPGWMEG